MSDFETVTVTNVPKDAFILDVREDFEWEAGHAAGATHVALGTLPERVSELDPDVDTYVICRTGGRPAPAAAWLNGKGYPPFHLPGRSDPWDEGKLAKETENRQEPTGRLNTAIWAPREPSPNPRCCSLTARATRNASPQPT